MQKPLCYPNLLGNSEVSLSELERLKFQWERRVTLAAARHPVPLTEIYSVSAEKEAKELLAAENATSWRDLSERAVIYANHLSEIEESQKLYMRMCDQIGLVYSPLVKVRRAQLQSVLSLGAFGNKRSPKQGVSVSEGIDPRFGKLDTGTDFWNRQQTLRKEIRWYFKCRLLRLPFRRAGRRIS